MESRSSRNNLLGKSSFFFFFFNYLDLNYAQDSLKSSYYFKILSLDHFLSGKFRFSLRLCEDEVIGFHHL